MIKIRFKSKLAIGSKIILTVILLYIVYLKSDLDILYKNLSQIDPLFWIAGYIVQNISVLLSGLRSRLYFKGYGLYLSIRNSISLYYIGMFYNLLLPSSIGGDGCKIYLLWTIERFSKLRSLRVLFYERLNGLMALVLIILILCIKSTLIELYQYAYQIIFALIILIAPSYLFTAHFIFRDKAKIALKCLPYSILSQGTHAISALLMLYAMDIDTNLTIIADYLSVLLVSSIVAIIPITVGGVGIRELTFLYAAKTLSIVDLNTGISFAICNYILYLSAGFTGVLFFYNLKNWKLNNGITKNTNSRDWLESKGF